jgi:hypothetical protein
MSPLPGMKGSFTPEGICWIRSKKNTKWNWTGTFMGSIDDGMNAARKQAKKFGKNSGIPSPGDIEIGCHKLYGAHNIPKNKLPELADQYIKALDKEKC